jgi:hypothetical protein
MTKSFYLFVTIIVGMCSLVSSGHAQNACDRVLEAAPRDVISFKDKSYFYSHRLATLQTTQRVSRERHGIYNWSVRY